MIKSMSHLEAKLGYSKEEMLTIIEDKERQHYHFSQSKGFVGGIEKFRHFHPSKKNLKDLQNRIQSRLFTQIALPIHIQGCTKGRGNITNAKIHQGKLYKLHTDLKSYFDFVSNKKVYKALNELGFSPKVNHLLTELTTFRGHLAQGPPTSPFLANVAALDMDAELLEIAGLHGLIYSRYVDDLCFSSQNNFKDIAPIILQCINSYGFYFGYRKTRFKAGRLELTGADIGQNLLRPTKKLIAKYVDPLTPDHTRKGLDIYFAGLRKK